MIFSQTFGTFRGTSILFRSFYQFVGIPWKKTWTLSFFIYGTSQLGWLRMSRALAGTPSIYQVDRSNLLFHCRISSTVIWWRNSFCLSFGYLLCILLPRVHFQNQKEPRQLCQPFVNLLSSVWIWKKHGPSINTFFVKFRCHGSYKAEFHWGEESTSPSLPAHNPQGLWTIHLYTSKKCPPHFCHLR